MIHTSLSEHYCFFSYSGILVAKPGHHRARSHASSWKDHAMEHLPLKCNMAFFQFNIIRPFLCTECLDEGEFRQMMIVRVESAHHSSRHFQRQWSSNLRPSTVRGRGSDGLTRVAPTTSRRRPPYPSQCHREEETRSLNQSRSRPNQATSSANPYRAYQMRIASRC